MVAAHPTRPWHMDRMRSHNWAKTDNPDVVICASCSLEFDDSFYLACMVPCPGSGYILKRREAGKHVKEE